jgi:hypothetical protein
MGYLCGEMRVWLKGDVRSLLLFEGGNMDQQRRKAGKPRGQEEGGTREVLACDSRKGLWKATSGVSRRYLAKFSWLVQCTVQLTLWSVEGRPNPQGWAPDGYLKKQAKFHLRTPQCVPAVARRR